MEEKHELWFPITVIEVESASSVAAFVFRLSLLVSGSPAVVQVSCCVVSSHSPLLNLFKFKICVI